MAEWNELDLGGVDAYAAAVKAGYTGTRQQWMTAMQDAEANGLKAEGYANGKQNGTAVESGTYFHDNAQYYKEQAEAAKTAAQAAQAAAESAAETDLVAWLEQHITNPDSPPLDRTLASSSSAAPADMVGDLKSAIKQIGLGYFLNNKWVRKSLNGETHTWQDTTIRISINEIQHTNDAILIVCDSGYDVAYQTWTSGGAFSSDSGWSGVGKITIPANTYFTVIGKKGNNETITLDDAAHFHFDYANELYKVLEDVEEKVNANTDYEISRIGMNAEMWPLFTNKGLNASHEWTDTNTRIAVTEIKYADQKVTINVDSGYDVAYQLWTSGGVFSSDTGWLGTSIVEIPAGSYYTVVGRKLNNATIKPSDAGHFKFDKETKISEKIIEIESDIKGMNIFNKGDYVRKTISSYDGQQSDSTTRISLRNRFKAPFNCTLIFKTNGMKIWWYKYYGESSNKVSNSGKYISDSIYQIELNYGEYINFVVSKQDDSTLTIEENTVKLFIQNRIDETIHNMNSVGHRGCPWYAPENTISGYIYAKRKGLKFVETDIHFTSDGVPVCLHDDVINNTARNSDGSAISETINIYDITFAESQNYVFCVSNGVNMYSQYPTEKLPSFSQYLNICRKLNLVPLIEIKDSEDPITNEKADVLINLVRKYGLIEKAIWFGYDYSGSTLEHTGNPNEIVAYIASKLPKATVGLSTTQLNSTIIDHASAIKTEQNTVFILDYYSNITAENVELVVAAKLELFAWTVNDRTTMLALNPIVTGAFTDNGLNMAQVFEDSTLEIESV